MDGSMVPLALLAVVLSVPSQPTQPLPAIDLPTLLQRSAARLAAPLPSCFAETETEEDLDRRGRTTALRICKTAQTRLPDGTEHREVIEAFENGYLVTGRVRRLQAQLDKETRDAKAKLSVYLALEVPFEAAQQGRYRFTLVGAVGPQIQVHFEPAADRRRLWVGDATLDAATGTILQLLGHPAVLPRLVDHMNVHMEFDPSVAAGPLPAKFVVEGSGHFLFFNKRMRYTSVTAIAKPVDSLAGGEE
jgi:hypothetical protein